MGFETAESIARFIQVVGLALAGASSFWAWRLVYLSRRHSDESLLPSAKQLSVPIIFGLLLLSIGWIGFEFANPAAAWAYEGIALDIFNIDQILIHQMELIVLILLILPIIALVWVIKNGQTNTLHLEWVHFLVFALLTAYCFVPIAVLPIRAGLFAGLHRWVAIPTLGTALTAGWLYMVNRHQKGLLILMSQFRAFAVVMWLGIALEFINNLGILNQALQVNTKFLFMQLLVGIIILNGVIFGQAIVARMNQLVVQKTAQLSHRFETLLLLSGAIAISAWLLLTWLDSFSVITHGFETLLVGYLFLTALVWSVGRLVIKIEV